MMSAKDIYIHYTCIAPRPLQLKVQYAKYPGFQIDTSNKITFKELTNKKTDKFCYHS